MKLSLLIMAVCCFCKAVTAQNKSTGFIGDARNGAAIEGAVVRNLTSNELAITNEFGKFVLLKPLHVTDSISVSAIAYQTGVVTGSNMPNIFLQPDVVQLREMTLLSAQAKPLNVIGKLDIGMRGLSNAQEVLRMVPGLFIGQHAGGGKAEQIFLRGFDIDHGTDVAITADGMPINMVSHAHGQGYADLHFLIPELIEQVQFGKGPYNLTKGNFATAGYVELQTKDRLEHSMIKVEGGQFNTLRTVAMIQLVTPKGKSKQGLYVAGEYLRSRGFFDAPQDFNRLNLFSRYDLQLSQKTQFNITAATFGSEWNASGQIPDRAVASGAISHFGAIDPNEGGNTHRSNINARLKTQLSESSFIKSQLYYTAYDFDLFSNFTFFLNDPVNGDQIRQKEKRSLWGYNSAFVRQGYVKSSTHTFEAGINFRADATRNSQLSHTLNRAQTLQSLQLGNISEWNAAAYVQETVQFGSSWTLTGGLRFDGIKNTYADALAGTNKTKLTAIASPKLNVTWQASDKASFYFSAGRGFHSNDSRVVVQTSGREALPAAFGTDLGVNAKPAKNLLLNAALWHLALEQEFVYVGDEGIVAPSGRTRRMGIDVSARYQPLRHLYLDADINYAAGSFTDVPKAESKLPLSPRFTSTGGITYKKPSGISGSLRYRWMGHRPANEDGSITAKGYFVADAVVSYLQKNLMFSIDVQNLANVAWKETQFATTSRLQNEPAPVTEIHFTPGTPLFLKAGVSYRF